MRENERLLNLVDLQFILFSCFLTAASIGLWMKGAAPVTRLRPIWVQLTLAGLFGMLARFAGELTGKAIWPAEVARALLSIAGIQLAVLVLFVVLLKKLRLPRFVGDMTSVIGYAVVLLNLLSRLGVNVTGLIATSAVATAVVGLSLQELLGNLAAGISLELEKELEVGSWVRTEAGTGTINHVRLRHTSITTADGDTVLIPNSVLTKSAVTLLSNKRRRLVKFILGYRRNPSRVVEAVEYALAASPLEGVAADPKPKCLILAFEKEHIEYGVQVWMTKPGHETSTTSAVLTRIYFALARIGAPMRPIAQVLDIHTEQQAAAEMRNESPDLLVALQHIPLFRALNDEELARLAPRLKHLSFAPGEVILRQGDDGESMFLILQGKAGVLLTNEAGLSQQVAMLQAGDFFGEMSLLTGEKRSATVVGMSQVDCLRLDKVDLYDMLNGRAEIAEDMSLVIAERQVELDAIREQLDLESSSRRIQTARVHLLERIKRFFGLPGLE